MDAQAQVNQITKYSSRIAIWVGKSATVLALVAILGYTQGLYGVDLQLRSNTPMVQVHLIVADSMPRLSWRRLLNLSGGMLHASSPSAPAAHEQACRQSQKQQVG
jgi:hypothetical protein